MQAMTSSGMPAFTSHSFARTPNVSKPRSTFDRSKPYKTTFDAGFWVPVYVEEILPGDTVKCNATLFARLLSALSVPIFDNMYMDWIAIFGANRILWDNFIKQMGEQHSPGDTIDYLTPGVTLPSGGVSPGDLADYFGIPINVGGSDSAVPLFINALPFRMYNLFIQQWVIAQNVVPGLVINTGDGPDSYDDYTLRRRMKRPDIFTSAQPATQKGSPVELPIGTSAPVVFPSNGNLTSPQTVTGGSEGDLGFLSIMNGVPWALVPTTDPSVPQTATIEGQVAMPIDAYANLAAAVGITINDFRLLATTQQFLELDERGGAKYPEMVFNHFGVTSSDARMQRIEFIAAGTIPIMTHVVPQTSATGTTAQGNLAAFTSAAGNVSFNHSFEEHGWLMVLIEVRADLTYQQGLEKKWSRKTRFDYYDPLFANIGEQPLLNQEIYAQGTTDDAGVFGFQEYAAEYRFGFGQVTGLMRDGIGLSVSVYNLSQRFVALPGLNQTFMEDNPPISRVVAVPEVNNFIFDSFWKMQFTRVMPTFSIPGLSRI